MAYKKLQIRRGLKADLPTLASGEFGFCTDTKEVFIGDGITNTLLEKAPVVVTGTLAAGTTSITLSNAAITTTSSVDIYTDKWGVNPTAVTLEAGKITLAFDTQTEALAVKVEVR